MGKHRSQFEFSEDSRVQGYSEGSERSICTPYLSAQTKVKRRRESVWDRSPWAHRARYVAGEGSGAREERRRKHWRPEKREEGKRWERKSYSRRKSDKRPPDNGRKPKSDDSGEKPTKAKLRRNTSNAMEFLAERSEKKKKNLRRKS